VLQLYLEGGAYDEATDSWVMAPPGASGERPFRLWAIGNVTGPRGRGAIENVRLAIAYREADLGLVISLKPARVGGDGLFHGFEDPSLPSVPVRNTTVLTSLGVVTCGPEGVVVGGARPLFDDGTPLPTDDVFGPGTVWQEFSLGDFLLTDSPIGDFHGAFPTDLVADAGQINVYEVSVTGGTGAELHFRLYGATDGQEKGATDGQEKIACLSAPDVEVFLCPEPPTAFVWCLLGLTFAGSAWMYHYLSRGREREVQELALALVPASSCARPIRGPREPQPALGPSQPLPSPTGNEGT
jgi:hypothetical protein